METASQKQTYYRGDFTRPLDEKNRLTIPVDWREKEPQLFIIVSDSLAKNRLAKCLFPLTPGTLGGYKWGLMV